MNDNIEWISVEDEVPDKCCTVLIWNRNYQKHFILCIYNSYTKEFVKYNDMHSFPLSITHWILIPDAPYNYKEINKE